MHSKLDFHTSNDDVCIMLILLYVHGELGAKFSFKGAQYSNQADLLYDLYFVINLLYMFVKDDMFYG